MTEASTPFGGLAGRLSAGPVVLPVATPEEMDDLGRSLASLLRAGDLLVLSGALGAGKTTMTRGLGDGLGVRGPVTSPTFVLARTHPSLVSGPALVHVDAYRLSSPVELDDLDIDYAGSVVVVEWGAGLLDGVADSWLEVAIERPGGARELGKSGDIDAYDAAELDAPEPRTVTLTPYGSRWA